MALHIYAGIIHQIQKQQNVSSDHATLQLQQKLHTVSNHLTTFVEYTSKQLQKSGKNSSISGGFGIRHTLSNVLVSDYFNKTEPEIDYLKLSHELAQGLFHFVVQKTATTGEYIPMVFYREDDEDYLLISLISLNEYININAQGEFSDTSVIDNDALKVGIKINLTQMAKHYNMPHNEQPDTDYIQWIQRSKVKLPEYIQDFIPVGEKIDNGKTTSSLLKCLMKYTQSVFSDAKTRYKVETDVITLMRNKFEHGESVHIEDDIDPLLDSALKTYQLDHQAKFSDYRQQEHIVLDSFFKVDGNKLKRYETFDLSLTDKSIVIKGKMDQLGESIVAVEQNGKKYLQIELNQKEYDSITTRYKSLLQ